MTLTRSNGQRVRRREGRPEARKSHEEDRFLHILRGEKPTYATRVHNIVNRSKEEIGQARRLQAHKTARVEDLGGVQ